MVLEGQLSGRVGNCLAFYFSFKCAEAYKAEAHFYLCKGLGDSVLFYRGGRATMTITSFWGDWLILAAGIFCLVTGCFLHGYPDKTIQQQIELSRHFNWRMEPIDRKKEIHDTRAMGLFSIFSSVWIFAFYFLRTKPQ